ncbi:MAG: aspartate 1-decarboxylase [Deltaproteobacteria bacterium]|nr:aspartate 1-decarboxylase [Deltaproteobacteria bacterium]
MHRSMFKSKIHRATVTEANLEYEGSITIDEDLMDAADMLPNEEIHVWNIDNGARLSTYILPGPRGTGTVCINGAAAHLVKPGHKVILATFAQMDAEEARNYKPTVVFVDQDNAIIETSYKEQPFRAALIQ